MLVQKQYQDTIKNNHLGFKIIDPLGADCFIEWEKIDTILFSPNRHSTDCAEWIIYLNSPPIWTRPRKLSWLGKFSFFIKDKKYKKQRIRDDINKDFYDFPAMVERYLSKTAEINYSEDNRKGELVSSKTTVKGNKTITQEYWKPKKSNELPWKMLYDRYNRTVDEIYKRDGAI
jgi:hypothetical protein